MIWQVPKMWEGGDVWILGGGPSVTKQFGIPDEVVQQVVNGSSPPSIYSPYMQWLHDKHVIGINVAFLIGDWIDMCFFGDQNFFNLHKVKLANFAGLKVTCYPNFANVNWIKYVNRDTRKPQGISMKSSCVSWNGNSGAAAISVAAQAGAKRIFLLGFDMKLNGEQRQHWHDLYGKATSVKSMKLPFNKHLAGFPHIDRDAKQLGITIINVCPDSAITQFPKCTLHEAMLL